MAGYRPSNPPPISAFNQPILQFPIASNPPASSAYPYQNQAPHPCPQPGVTMGGYPTSASYPNAGSYPASGAPMPTPGFNNPVSPSAPDMSKMEKIPGYESVTFEETIIPPFVPQWEPDYNERRELENLPSLTDEDVREAIIEYSSENCCYGSDVAENMTITNITMMSSFHYVFETFGEKRSFLWRFEPFKGELIDGPMNGPAPAPWDVEVSPRWYFKNGRRKVEVPHTAFVKPCHKCIGNLRVRCESCFGNGRYKCNTCGGRGKKHKEPCRSCNGSGMKRCNTCCGHGQVTCKTCDGRGQLKCFVELTVIWTAHVDDYISEASRFPKELLLQATGKTALEEEFPRINPIMNTQDDALRKVSNEFVRRHNTAFPNERILRQRHTLRLFPVGEVNYVWEEKTGSCYVYGYENKVYCSNYPQTCCSIM